MTKPKSDRARAAHVAPALVKLEHWVEGLFGRTARFPRTLRHSLTERIERRGLDALEALTRARFAPGGRATAEALADADAAFNQLQILLRMAHRLGALSAAAYEELSTTRSELGRMVGGWRRDAESRARPSDAAGVETQ